MNSKELLESIKNSEKELDKWWNENYEKAINYVDSADPQYIADLIYNGDTDMYYNQTAKHVALNLLYQLGIKDFEEEISLLNDTDIDEPEDTTKGIYKIANEWDGNPDTNKLNDFEWKQVLYWAREIYKNALKKYISFTNAKIPNNKLKELNDTIIHSPGIIPNIVTGNYDAEERL